MPFKTVRRRTVIAPPFGFDLWRGVSPIACFLIKLDIILTYRDQSCPAGHTPAAARRRLISCKDCDVFCGISSRFADDAIRFPDTWIRSRRWPAARPDARNRPPGLYSLRARNRPVGARARRFVRPAESNGLPLSTARSPATGPG